MQGYMLSVSGGHMLARRCSSVTGQRQRKYRGQEEMFHCSPEAEGLSGDRGTLSL